MKAVIMAGGEGTRLRPLTCSMPKPMVPVVNKPVMEHILLHLKSHRIFDVAVTLQYMPDIIRDYFGDGSSLGLNIQYFEEKHPLGTAGSVKNTGGFTDGIFLVLSGDALTDIDLSKAVAFHKEKGAVATIVLKKVETPLEYGVVVTGEDGRITRFLEKPGWGEVFSDTVNTGIYVLSPDVLKQFDGNKPFDFSKDVFPALLEQNRPLYGFVTEDYWCDIGDIKAYLKAHEDILNNKVRIRIPGKEIIKGVWAGEGTEIDDGVKLKAPCVIGKSCRINSGAVIGEYSVIGDNSTIESMAGIKKSVLWENSFVGSRGQLRGCVVGSKVHLEDRVSAFEGSVISDESFIKEGAVIKPYVRIWPGKLVDKGAVVSCNMVWGSRCARAAFGDRGISGEINADITPEYALRLAEAFGAVLGKGAKISISSDSYAPLEMIKAASVAGLLSSGAEVFDCGELLLPVARSAVRFYNLSGGMHICNSPAKPEKLKIEFFNHQGSNIDRATERKIENLFARGDYPRYGASMIRNIQTINGYTEFYLQNIINSVRPRSFSYRIALTSCSDSALNIMCRLLSCLGCMPSVKRLEGSETASAKRINRFMDFELFAKQVKDEKFDLGVLLGKTMEKMMLVDSEGKAVTGDMYMGLVSLIIFNSYPGSAVVVPASASNVVERLADLYKGRVIRTKTSERDFIGKILSLESKGEIAKQFEYHFDACAGLVKILDFMSSNNISLSRLIEMVPEFHISRKEVECPWTEKGKVIREIIQENANETLETIDGVKIYNDLGWVMVLPDSEQPTCTVISEGYTAELAEELASVYIDKIREISGT